VSRTRRNASAAAVSPRAHITSMRSFVLPKMKPKKKHSRMEQYFRMVLKRAEEDVRSSIKKKT